MKKKETETAAVEVAKVPKKKFKLTKKYLSLYALLIPGMIAVIIFQYCPMPGVVMAFEDYDMFRGMWGSPFVGFKHFKEIFTLPAFSTAIVHTLTLSFINLLFTQPVPIIFALLLNEVKARKYKRIVQTISYLPHFLSSMAVIGMVHALMSTYGIFNDARVLLLGEGTERIKFLAQQHLFVPNIITIGIWQGFGWNSIIYLSAISGIDPELYEAASVDGANKFKQCLHITIPSILPTFLMLFIMAIGRVFSDNFDMVYGLQNAYIDYETISTVVYKQGIQAGNYSVATALGLFQGVAGFILVTIANTISKKVNDVALW
ncbi:MAG: sugar ABC transporter permease [Clostridia bacterium]|nr:sugar ABC transporter permease [Clostridia bacterium]